MDKFFTYKIVKNTKGQSVVEYILLFAVIAGLGTAVFSNKKFKSFLAGTDGLFATMKKGMAYSYRYGREYRSTSVDFESSMNFDYSSNKHPTYTDSTTGNSRFFLGHSPYPR